MMSKIVNRAWRLAGGDALALCARLGVGLVLLLAWPALSAGPAAAEPTCTDPWTGGAGTESWTASANWTTGVPGPSDVACIGPGVTVQVTSGSNSVGSIQDEGSLVISGGSLAVSDESATSSVGSLSLSSEGSLSVAGTLDVASWLATTGRSEVSGAGRLVVESGATGVLDDPGCSRLLLSGVTLVNDGTVTVGVSGGSLDGSITMSSGAQLENAGTFNTDAYESGCGPESNGYSFRAGGGSASAITNTSTGTFSVDIGSGNTAQVAIPYEPRDCSRPERRAGTDGGRLLEWRHLDDGKWYVGRFYEWFVLVGGR